MRDIVLKRTFSTQYLTEPLYEGDGGYKLVLNYGRDLTGCEIAGKVKRSDGTVVTYLGAAEGNYAYCRIEAGAFNVVGEIEIRLEIISGDGVVTAIDAEGVVKEKLAGTDVTSDDRYPVLTSLINEVRGLKQNYADTIKEQDEKSATNRVFKGVITSTDDVIAGIIAANEWKTGWCWRFDIDTSTDYLEGFGGTDIYEIKKGYVLEAVKDHPEEAVLPQQANIFFRITTTGLWETPQALEKVEKTENWKDAPVLTIEVTEQCAAIDVTEIDGKAFEFSELAGYAQLVTNSVNEGRLAILLNRTGSGASYNGLVCLQENGASTQGAAMKGVFEVKKEYGMWHTSNVGSNGTTWLAMNAQRYEHWDSRDVFASVDSITSFRLIPYSGNFNAGTVIKIFGKAVTA